MVLEPQPDLPHSHCDMCYCQYCGVSPEPHVACALVNCELDCGAKFHICKLQEHKLLCSNEKVSCINSIYGCPLSVLRCHMSKHLAVCPASVIHCTMEWNRWPVCSAERQSHQPIQLSPDFNCEQLDIALALRDQRMLTKSMRASKRTRQILTNTLNRRHPAVPLSEALTNGDREGFDEQKELQNLLQSMHEWEQQTERKRARTPPGLERSICSELYKATKEATDSLAVTLEVAKAQYPRYPYIHCAHCEKRKARMERLMESHNAMKDSGDEEVVDDEEHHKEGEAMDQECSEGAKASVAEDIAVTDPNIDSKMADEEEHCNHDNHLDPDGPDYLRIPNSQSPLLSSSSEEDLEKPSLFVTPSTTGEVSAAPSRGHAKTLIIQPPSKAAGAETLPHAQLAGGVSPTSGQPLSLDLSLESITRYQAKPDSMYTFLCAQEFRRDEFAYHFQNVHSDIHGGLNGWLEQRCPLAPYGCTFSQRRFYPGSHGARIIHSEGLESFGIVLNEGKDGKGDKARSPQHKFIPLLKIGAPDAEKGKDSSHSTCMASNLPSMPKEGSVSEPAEGGAIIDQKTSAMRDSEDVTSMKPDTAQPLVVDSNSCRTQNIDVDKPQSIPMDTTASQQPCIQSDNLESKAGSKVTASYSICNQSVPSPTKSSQSEEGVDYLSELPLEVLRYLTRFLDGFSMCNLAMTSKLLRQVCCSMLEERGMVVLQWEKHRGHWQVAYKVWHFSTAFSPVLRWGFEDHPSMAMHLRTCPYNVKLHQTEPVRVMAQNAEPIGLRADAQERNLGWAFARH